MLISSFFIEYIIIGRLFMDILSKEKTVISDIINRVLSCREIKSLYVFGEPEGELEWLYPGIQVFRGRSQKDATGDVVYIHIANRDEFDWMIPWVVEEKEIKDFILYVSPDADISAEEMKILGSPHYLDRYSGLKGILFLVGISFQKPRELIVPDSFKVLAVIHFYNEADILGQTIQYLLSQEVDIYLLDNWSDDGSYEIAQKYQEADPGRIHLERFPAGKSDNFELYDQLEKTEMISKELDYNWYVHYDSDEIRMSPWEGVTLREAIYCVDRQGYNCIENTVIDFRFTEQDSDNIFMKDGFFDFRHQKKLFNHLKTWKKSQQIDLKSSGGHFAHIADPRIYPLKFLNRHFPLRSMKQAEKKVFQDRLPRFAKERGERGWHAHYDRFKKAEDFIFDSSKLLCWQPDTFHELYIPLFLECGLRWDINDKPVNIELQDIENRKVILYGAGNMGKSLYLELMKKNRVVAWVDKQYGQLPAMFCEKVVSPQEMLKTDYDYVVLAVKKTELVQEIKKELTGIYAVPEEKILCMKDVGGNQVITLSDSQ